MMVNDSFKEEDGIPVLEFPINRTVSEKRLKHPDRSRIRRMPTFTNSAKRYPTRRKRANTQISTKSELRKLNRIIDLSRQRVLHQPHPTFGKNILRRAPPKRTRSHIIISSSVPRLHKHARISVYSRDTRHRTSISTHTKRMRKKRKKDSLRTTLLHSRSVPQVSPATDNCPKVASGQRGHQKMVTDMRYRLAVERDTRHRQSIRRHSERMHRSRNTTSVGKARGARAGAVKVIDLTARRRVLRVNNVRRSVPSVRGRAASASPSKRRVIPRSNLYQRRKASSGV
eukprot:42297_1